MRHASTPAIPPVMAADADRERCAERADHEGCDQSEGLKREAEFSEAEVIGERRHVAGHVRGERAERAESGRVRGDPSDIRHSARLVDGIRVGSVALARCGVILQGKGEVDVMAGTRRLSRIGGFALGIAVCGTPPLAQTGLGAGLPSGFGAPGLPFGPMATVPTVASPTPVMAIANPGGLGFGGGGLSGGQAGLGTASGGLGTASGGLGTASGGLGTASGGPST